VRFRPKRRGGFGQADPAKALGQVDADTENPDKAGTSVEERELTGFMRLTADDYGQCEIGAYSYGGASILRFGY
jgi:hypothetical protein